MPDDTKPTVLPDGSAFFTVSLPLPADHWLYAPREGWDSERDEFAECPRPVLTNAQREAVRAAARYAVRGATMCGKEMDFDPDALVLNMMYALCGPANPKLLPVDAPAPAAQPAMPGPVAWIEHEWSGTGQRHLTFERRAPTVRDEVVNPMWTPLYTPEASAALAAQQCAQMVEALEASRRAIHRADMNPGERASILLTIENALAAARKGA